MATINFDNKLIFILDNDQPTTCPMCGARTEFEDVNIENEVVQYHKCLDRNCGFDFIGESDFEEIG